MIYSFYHKLRVSKFSKNVSKCRKCKIMLVDFTLSLGLKRVDLGGGCDGVTITSPFPFLITTPKLKPKQIHIPTKSTFNFTLPSSAMKSI